MTTNHSRCSISLFSTDVDLKYTENIFQMKGVIEIKAVNITYTDTERRE